MRDQNNERGFAIAAVIASIHPVAWYFAVLLLFLLVATSSILNWHQIPAFISSFLFWVRNVLIVAALVMVAKIVVWAIHMYQDTLQKVYKTRSEKEKSRKAFWQTEAVIADVELKRQLPAAMNRAFEYGFNVEYANFKMSDWRSNMHMLQGPGGQGQLPAPNIILPAKTEMIAVARRQDFSRDNIFLALAGAGEDVTTTIGGYVHAANDGSTGSGKTTNWRGQLVQFVKADVGCILLNPHFSLRTKAGDDWKPIARALESQGSYGLGNMPRVVTQFANIGAVLAWMAMVEIDRRFEMMRRECFDYQPLYAYIDEWPSVVTNCKEAPEHLRTILQRGRAVEVCVSVNSQGFLANDTDLRGSARENFDTAFWMGGSTYSGAKMLDLKEAELKDMIKACPENIGKGVAFLRNNASCADAQIVRLPYADNEFVYHCLGRADGYQLPQEEVVTVESTQPGDESLDAVYEACMQLKEEGIPVKTDTVKSHLDAIGHKMARGKVGNLMKELTDTGCEIR